MNPGYCDPQFSFNVGGFPNWTPEIPVSQKATYLLRDALRYHQSVAHLSKGVPFPLSEDDPLAAGPGPRGRPFPSWGLPPCRSFRPRPRLYAASVLARPGCGSTGMREADAGRTRWGVGVTRGERGVGARAPWVGCGAKKTRQTVSTPGESGAGFGECPEASSCAPPRPRPPINNSEVPALSWAG